MPSPVTGTAQRRTRAAGKDVAETEQSPQSTLRKSPPAAPEWPNFEQEASAIVIQADIAPAPDTTLSLCASGSPASNVSSKARKHVPRMSFYLSRGDFRVYGYTEGCPACADIASERLGRMSDAHTRACRTRMHSTIQAADPLRWERYLRRIHQAAMDHQAATSKSVVLVTQHLPGLPRDPMGETAWPGTTSLVAQDPEAATLSRSRVAQLPEAYCSKAEPTSLLGQHWDELVTANTRPRTGFHLKENGVWWMGGCAWSTPSGERLVSELLSAVLSCEQARESKQLASPRRKWTNVASTHVASSLASRQDHSCFPEPFKSSQAEDHQAGLDQLEDDLAKVMSDWEGQTQDASQANPSQVVPHVLDEVIDPHEPPTMRQEYTSQHRHSGHKMTRSDLEHHILVYRDEEPTDSTPAEWAIRRQLSMLFAEELSPDLIIRHRAPDAADPRSLTVLVYDGKLASIAGKYGVFGAMTKGGQKASGKKKTLGEAGMSGPTNSVSRPGQTRE